jgi:hypothetical protein
MTWCATETIVPDVAEDHSVLFFRVKESGNYSPRKGATSQKTRIFTNTAVRISNLALLCIMSVNIFVF